MRPVRLVEGILGGQQPDHGIPVEGRDFRIGQVRPERRDELIAPGNGRLRAGISMRCLPVRSRRFPALGVLI